MNPVFHTVFVVSFCRVSIFENDQNDWIGFMGRHPLAITPNIDKLAKSGTAFTNVHSQ